MSVVQTEVDHLQLIVRNYPTKYLYTITFNSMVASEDENNKKKTLFKEKNLLIKKKWSKNGSTNIIWNTNLFWEFTDGTRKIERFQWIKIAFSS